MKIIDCYVAVFSDNEAESPDSDVLCKIITISNETFTTGTKELETIETYQCAYVFNPETGEVQRVRLVDIIINTYENEDKSIVTCSNPTRIETSGENHEVRNNNPDWDSDRF